MFSGNCRYGSLSISTLSRYTVYDSPLTAQDTHIRYFWLSLFELSFDQLRTLLRALSLYTLSSSVTSNKVVTEKERVREKEREKERVCDWHVDKHLYCASLVYGNSSTTSIDHAAASSSTISGSNSGSAATTTLISSLPVPSLRIMKPTAAALLLADSTEITLFPDMKAISVPRYSSLKVMQLQVRQLIKSLESAGY